MNQRGYRVYDKQKKRMIDFPASESIFLSGNGNLVKPDNCALYLMDRYVRMDSTGICDKSGKEIYEGDCLGGAWGDGWIAYCDKCKSFEYFIKDFGCSSCTRDIEWSELVEQDGQLEVIGNLYQNPGLLEVKAK